MHSRIIQISDARIDFENYLDESSIETGPNTLVDYTAEISEKERRYAIENLVNHLQEGHPADIKIATLLFKPEALVKPVNPDYVGFSIPKKFIIGFGLDINKKGRNLKDIYVLKED